MKTKRKKKVLDFFDVKIILHEDNSVETDIYYKPTNTHDYLPYNSAYGGHTKNNILYHLAKKIIVFVSNPENTIICLNEFRQLLKECKYPEHVISIFNAKFQGPAPNPEKKNVIPFVTTYYCYIDNKSLKQTVKNKFKNIRHETLNLFIKIQISYCL